VPQPRSAGAPRIGAAVARFMLVSLAAMAVIVVGAFFALREVAINEAERDTRVRVQSEARLVETAGLRDGILRADPAAIRRLDDVVLGQIVSGSLVRVKLWSKDGTILYSDEPELIGKRFELGDDEAELFETGGTEAELSDLARPENRYERPHGKLLEAHTPIRTPDGTQVLFEIYQRFGSVNAGAQRLLGALAPPLLAGVAVLLLLQVPLAWTMARRLQRGHHERERLLANAVEASSEERRRIAADLHDGVVQDLAAVSYSLAAAAESAPAPVDAELREAAAETRRGIRQLRTLLLEIYPPELHRAGLAAALADLLTASQARGIETSLDADLDAELERETEALLYRVAQEALRNVIEHAAADRVGITVARDDGRIRLLVEDDGRGFDPVDASGNGHFGLRMLADLVRDAGGVLEVDSAPGSGSRVSVEVPA
jgi:signal transduction histidine kinase